MIDYIRWVYQWFKGEILAIPGRVIAVVFFTFLLLLPLITTSPSTLRFLIMACIFAIFAASWDLLAVTGQVSLGHALFFGSAGYTAALINIHFGLPAWITIPLGGLSAVVVGLLAGIPALRLRGFYLSLVTLAYPVILTGIIFVFPDFFGGEMGLIGISRLSGSRVGDYYTVVLIMAFSGFIMWKLSDAGSKVLRTGVVFHAIREDEIAARNSGINTVRYKLMAYAFSGFFGGVAGGLYIHFIRIAGPSSLEVFFSVQALLWAVFGGMGTIYGAIVGVFILFPLTEYLRIYEWGEALRFVIVSLVLIFILLFMPEGISVWVLDKIEIRCRRCKVVNIATRRNCRTCRAPLRLEREK
ncbi:MAG: branched-chain amino acid ABC transporter permease [Desulfobacteraceae bacterium]|nr:MAG: branched-chain amino acid ABC transporter permease [Desulfobacteraceae bacterium]